MKEEIKQDSCSSAAVKPQTLSLIIDKIGELCYLSVEDFSFIGDTLASFRSSCKALGPEDAAGVIRFLQVLWLASNGLPWEEEKARPVVSEVGRSVVRIVGELVEGLREMKGDCVKVKSVERHLLELCEVVMSPISFVDRQTKLRFLSKKIQKEPLISLLSPFFPKEDPFPPSAGILTAYREDMGTVNEKLAAVIDELQTYAVEEAKIPELWVKHFVGTFCSPPWNSEAAQSGWSSFNICILCLEFFADCEGMRELKGKLMKEFIDWSEKALEELVRLIQSFKESEADLVLTLYSGYMFPIFIFYGYAAKENPEVSLTGLKLATGVVQKLIEIDTWKSFSAENLETLFESFYFLFSFMCKSVSTGVLSGDSCVQTMECDYVKLGLRLFECIAELQGDRKAGKESRGGIVWDVPLSPDKAAKKKTPLANTKKAFNKPLELPKEALNSLEEIVAMLGCLIGKSKDPLTPLINKWLADDSTLSLLLHIVNGPHKVANTEINSIIGKLVIEVTQKDACYSFDAWQSIIASMRKYLDEEKEFNGYLFSLLIKLSLCCYSKLGGKSKEEVERLKSLWIDLVRCLVKKDIKDSKVKYKEVAILFILQTLLKDQRESILSTIFIQALQEQTSERGKYYQLFLRLSAALPLETEGMKQCSELLTGILLRGAEPSPDAAGIGSAQLAPAFHRLVTLFARERPGEDLLSLDNLAALCNPGSLFEQILKCPELISFPEESKLASPNYYLRCLITLAGGDIQGAAGSFQETMLALLQSYIQRESKVSLELVYWQGIIHSYTLFAEFLARQNVPLPNPQDFLEFISISCGHALEVLSDAVLAYYKFVLEEKKELQSYSEVLRDATLISHDLKKLLASLGLESVDVSFFTQVSVPAFHLDTLAAPAEQKSLTDSFAKAIEGHFSNHLQASSSASHFYRGIFSTILVIQSLVKASELLLRTHKLPADAILPVIAQASSVHVLSQDYPAMKKVVKEIFRMSKAGNTDKVQNSALQLIIAKKISQIIQELLPCLKEKKDRTIEPLLELWSANMKSIAKEPMAEEIADYDTARATADITSLIGSEGQEAKFAFEIMLIIFDCVPEKEAVDTIRKQMIAAPDKFLHQMFLLKDIKDSLHSMFSKLMADCKPMQDKIFRVIKELLLARDKELDNLDEYLLLLTDLIAVSNDLYLSPLITEVMPSLKENKNEEVKDTLINFLTTISYESFSIVQPKELDLSSEVIENLADGYGHEKFVKKTPPGIGERCALTRARKKNEQLPCYYCYTCEIANAKTCCSACAKNCHRGHKVIFAKTGALPCMCQGEGKCLLMPKEEEIFDSHTSYESLLVQYKQIEGDSAWMGTEENHSLSRMLFKKLADVKRTKKEVEAFVESSEESEDSVVDEKAPGQFYTITGKVNESIVNKGSRALKKEDIKDDKALKETVLASADIRREAKPKIEHKQRLKEAEAVAAQGVLIDLYRELQAYAESVVLAEDNKNSATLNDILFATKEKTVKNVSGLVQLSCEYDVVASNAGAPKKSLGSMYSEIPPSFRSHLAQYPNARNFATKNTSGLLALVFKDHVNIYNSDFIRNNPSSLTEKVKLPPISNISMGFFITCAKFNRENETYLAVAGMQECTVVTLDASSGKVASKLPVDLMLRSMGDDLRITKVEWIPGSQVHLAIAVQIFVKVFDLSADNIAPIYTLNSTDQEIKDLHVINEAEDHHHRFFFACGERLNTNVLEIPPRAECEATVDIVQTVELPAEVGRTALVSVCYAAKAKLLVVALSDGRVVYGEFDSRANRLKRASVVCPGKELKYFFALEEIALEDKCLWISSMSMSGQLQGCLLKIEEKEVQLQVLKQKIEGTCLLGKEEDAWKVITASDNAYVCSFELPPKKSPAKPHAAVKDYSQLFKTAHLPKVVSLPVGWLEKAVNAAESSGNLANAVRISASSDLLADNSNETLFEKLFVNSGKSAIKVNAPSVSIEITLTDTSSYVPAGLRILTDTRPNQYVLLFNRSVKLGTVAENVTEIPFCDAEILSVSNGTFKLTLKSENEPLVLRGIELYAFSKDVFKLSEKLDKIDQILLSRTSSRKEENKDYVGLLSTTTYELLPWDKKCKLLAQVFDGNSKLKAFVNSLDFLSYTAYTTPSVSGKTARALVRSLAAFMHVQSEELQIRAVRSAARKCVKALVWNATQGSERVEGDEFHYQTCKCFALFDYLRKAMKKRIGVGELEKGLKSMAKSVTKAKLAFFEGVMKNEDVIEWLSAEVTSSLKSTYVSKSICKNVLEKFTIVMIGYCDYLLNLKLNAKTESTSKLAKNNESVKLLLKFFIFSKDEEMAASFITLLSELLTKHDKEYINSPITKKYARDFFNSKDQPANIEVYSFDFSHEISFCLCTNIIEQKDSTGRVYIAPFVLLRELLYHYSVRKKTKDDSESWKELFCTLVGTVITKNNPLNSSDAEAVLLGLKLLNSLFSANSMTLKEEVAVEFIAACYKNNTLVAWIAASIEKLAVVIKEKKSAVDVAQEKPDTVTFLKPRFKRNTWEIFATAGSDEELFHEIINLCFNFSLREKDLPQRLNTVVNAPVLVDILRHTLCEFALCYSERDFRMKALFRALFASKDQLAQYKDNFTYSLKLKGLKQLDSALNYESQVNVYKSLNDVWKVAKSRSVNWKEYIKNNPGVVATLFKIATAVYEKTAFQALSLAALALETEDSSELSIKSTFEMLANHFIGAGKLISALMWAFSRGKGERKAELGKVFEGGLEIGNEFVLNSASVQMRVAAAYLLKGLYFHSNEEKREVLLKNIGEKVTGSIHSYGCAALQVLSLLLCILNQMDQEKSDHANKIIKKIVESAKEALDIIRSHENAQIYSEVQSMSENEFLYCLEEIPCQICISDIAQDYTSQKINDIRQDFTFTTSAFIYKLTNSYSIQKITLDLSLLEGRRVTAVNVYHSSAKSARLSELRDNWKAWKRAGSIALRQKTQSSDLEFSVPVVTSLLKIEFVAGAGKVEESLGRLGYGGEPIFCPRCSSSTANMQGICRNCGESIFQCPNCRNVNYEKFASLICTECGFFKHGKVDITLSAQLSFGGEKIESEKDKREIQRALSETLAAAMKHHEALKESKCSLVAMAKAPAIKMGKKTARVIDMHTTYTSICVPNYKSLVKLLRNANSMKSELLQYANSSIADSYKLEPSNNCYGCSETFLQIFLKFVELSANSPFCCKLYKDLPIKDLLFTSMFPCSSPSIAKLLIKAISSLSANDMHFAEVVLARLNAVVSSVRRADSLERIRLRDETVLCVELLVRVHSRLLLIMEKSEGVSKRHEQVFGKVNESLWKILKESFPIANSSVADEIIQPLFNYVLEVIYLPVNFDTSKLLAGENLYAETVKQCLTYPESKRLRETTADLIKRLIELKPETIFSTFSKLAGNLSETFGIPQESAESLLSVFKHLVRQLSKKEHAKEFSKLKLAEQILAYAEQQIAELQGNARDGLFWTGYSLHSLLEVVLELIQKTSLPSELIHHIIRTYSNSRKLRTMGSNYIDKSISTLKAIFHAISIDDLSAKKTVIHQCVRVLSENAGAESTRAALYAETYRVVTAGKPEPNYSLVLQRAPSQLMFIRGGLSRSSYLLSEVGSTVRDLRKAICSDPKMRSSEQILEILAADSILGLDLNLKLVYEMIWWPYIQKLKNPDANKVPPIEEAKSDELEPMKLVYRLAGVDGEAVEARVDKLEAPPVPDSPESALAAASAFLDEVGGRTGLGVVLEDAKKMSAENTVLTNSVTSLLEIFAKIKQCRKKIVELKGHDLLAEKAMEKPGEELSDRLLGILVQILKEESEAQIKVESSEWVSKLLERLKADCDKCKSISESSKQSTKTLTRILPYFAYDSTKAMEALLGFFKDSANFDCLNESKEKVEVAYSMNRAIEIIEGVPLDRFKLKDALIDAKVTQTAIDYLKKWMERDMDKHLTGLQYALRFLLELGKNHEATQALIVDVIEPISKLAKKKAATTFEATCKKFMDQIHKSVKNEELRKCLEAYSQEVGKSGELQLFSDDEAEDKVLACAVCGKNYATEPENLLGVYVYEKCRYVSVDKAPVLKVTMLTHMNAVHEKCHYAGLPSGNEWDKASERNSKTKCNLCLPLHGGAVPDETFKGAVRAFTNRLKSEVEGKAGWELMIYSIKWMLKRYAYEETFGIYSHNGGQLHNLQFIPFMMQTVFYLGTLKEYSIPKLHEDLRSFIEETHSLKRDIGLIIKMGIAIDFKRIKPSIKASTDDCLFFSTLSLLFVSPEEWPELKAKLLCSMVQVAVCGSVTGTGKRKRRMSRGSLKAEEKSPEFLKELKPLLVLLVLVDSFKMQLKGFVKESVKTPEDLIASLFEGIKNHKAKCLKMGEEICALYNKMTREFHTVEQFVSLLKVPSEISNGFNQLAGITIE